MATTAQKYLRPEVIAQVQQLDLRARFIVEGFLSGLHDSPYHGFSVEFSEHRKYVPGDDLRNIDWHVYGKTDRFYIKKYQAETNLQAYLLVDASASMDYTSRPAPAPDALMSKFEYGVCLAAALGYMMIHQQDAVGLFTFSDRLLTHLPAKSKRAHLMNLLSVLANTKPAGRTNLAAALHDVAGRIRKRGLMILFSDLLNEPEAVIDAMHHIRFAGHELMVFQVLDEAEAEFPFSGQVRFQDVETPATVTTDPQAIREGYLQALRQFVDNYRRSCLNMGADFTQVTNAMTFDKALIQFLAERQSRF